MSPLTCSLFALAALFAATNALPNPYCDSLMQGREDYEYEKSILFASDGILKIPDNCDGPTRKLVGQSISVCNRPNYQPTITEFFDIKDPFSKVKIDCPAEFVGCSDLTVLVIQYCENYIGKAKH